MNKEHILNESIVETQNVQFIFDDNPELEGLCEINISLFQKVIVFCDINLKRLWWPKIESILKDKITLHLKYLNASEQTKNLESYVKLVGYLEKIKCTRDDLIVAVGGGTILDAVSYLSSTYMRGISLFMIPTTIIGQADASTAGKTCINTEYAKNVLGTLYLPKIVYNNVAILRTNSEYENRQGFSEIFKYGLLGSKKLLKIMEEYIFCPNDKLLVDILKETIKVRLSIRRKDPLASNLGHTFGHALEKISQYTVNHGDAISVGIVMALEFSLLEGIIETAYKDKIIVLMDKLGLNTKVQSGICPETLSKIMLTDKKSSNSQIRLVLIKNIAEPYICDGSYFYPVETNIMLNFLKNFLNDKRYICNNHWKNLKN